MVEKISGQERHRTLPDPKKLLADITRTLRIGSARRRTIVDGALGDAMTTARQMLEPCEPGDVEAAVSKAISSLLADLVRGVTSITTDDLGSRILGRVWTECTDLRTRRTIASMPIHSEGEKPAEDVGGFLVEP